MIGNDIVDLTQARRESNWRRKGFLDKLFTTYEQQLIWEADTPDPLVWLLWSMKESVYKLAVRHTLTRVFAPRQIACCPGSSSQGTIDGSVVYGETYQTRSVSTPHYITTVAFAANTTPAYTQVIIPFDTTRYQEHQSIIRKEIRQQCLVSLGIAESEIRIHKNAVGAPLLLLGESTQLPLSISHHGHYGAFVIGLPT